VRIIRRQVKPIIIFSLMKKVNNTWAILWHHNLVSIIILLVCPNISNTLTVIPTLIVNRSYIAINILIWHIIILSWYKLLNISFSVSSQDMLCRIWDFSIKLLTDTSSVATSSSLGSCVVKTQRLVWLLLPIWWSLPLLKLMTNWHWSYIRH